MRRVNAGIGCGVFAMLAMFLGGPASAATIVDMNFDGPTGLENAGAGPDGVLMNGASIVGGELVLDGSNEPEPDEGGGAGLNLDIGSFQTFSGNGNFHVEFDFASINGDTGPLFSADSSLWLEEQGIEPPGDEENIQEGILNIYFFAGELEVDTWYIEGGLTAESTFNDDLFHHVELSYDASAAELTLVVDDLDPVVSVVGEFGDGFSRDTINDITRLGDENNADIFSEAPWSDLEGCHCRFDNLLITGPDPPPVKLIVDRTTGDISMEVLGDVNIVELAISSEAGTLIPGGYDGLAATGGAFADWVVSNADEFEIVEGGSAGDLTAGQNISLGSGVWTPFWDEDLGIAVNDTVLGELVDGITEYVNGDPLLFGDLDVDGLINEADWLLFVEGYGSDLDELTPFEAYFLADLNGDFEHNAEDFTEFVIAFDEFNGEGAFAGLIGGSVPEPGTLALFGVVLAGLAVMRRRRISPLMGRSLALFVVATAMVTLAAPTAQADLLAQYLFETAFEDTSTNGNTGIPQTPGFGQPTVSGGRIQMTGALLEYMEIPLGAANPFGGSENFAVQMLFNTTGNTDAETGVILFGSAAAFPADWEAAHTMSIFVEPQFEEEVEPGVFETFGGALVYDNFFVGEIRTPDLLLLDGEDHPMTVVYVAPEDLGEPDDPNPGRLFIQVDDEWVARGEIAPYMDIADNAVSLGSTLNEDYPFDFNPDENSNLTLEFAGSMDNVNIWDGQDAADLAPSELRATVNVNDRTIELVGGEYAEEIKFYEILSDNAALGPSGWAQANLDAQELGDGTGVGENWDTLDGTDGRLAEGYLMGSTLTEDGTVLTLINAYNPYAAGVAENDGVDDSLSITIVDADLEIRELAIEFVGDFCTFPSDFDCDGDVDGDDFLLWQTGFGRSDGLAQRQDGDADGDGDVDGDDFLVWQSEFGSADGAASAVPEPSGLLVAVFAVLGFWPAAVRRRAA